MKSFGWKVKGIEPDSKASEKARNEHGLDVETGSIFNFDFPKESFDVIILDMVLEHLYNPDIAIKKISDWLKSGGQLIFSIPYFYGVEYKFFKEYSFHHFDRDIVASSSYKYKKTDKIFYQLLAQNKPIKWLIIKPFVFILSLLKCTSRVTVFTIKK